MIDLTRGGFQESKTYQAYDSNKIFKVTPENLIQILEQIKKENINEKVLIELSNTIGLTDEIINNLSDNIDVRIIGALTEEYAKSFISKNMDFLREKVTYSKKELQAIMNKIKLIEANINPNWNKYEKALYLYEYLKSDIVYRNPSAALDGNGRSLDLMGNSNRTRTWDTLTGLINQLSTCSGFSHIYQELCTRQGINCVKVGGRYEIEGDHAWNLVSIDGKTFLVDIIWDAIDYEKGIDHITRFGTCNSEKYKPLCYVEQHKCLSTIDQEWINSTKDKILQNIPKEHLIQQKIENFLQLRELDRQRMMQLRQQQLSNLNLDSQLEELSHGGTLK